MRPLANVLNAAFARLEAAFARQIRFTADAAHELRTPLAVVLSQAEVALSKQRSEGEYRLALEACARAAQRMNALTEKLLLLARRDSCELAITWRAFDLVSLIRRVAGEFEREARDRGLTVRLDLHEIAGCGDADLLGQAIANLVANAIRYSHRGGEVRVHLTGGDTPDTCVITVADTGPGIAPDDQPRIFERFYRADPARSQQPAGAGLGLAIAREIVAAHHGTISLESEPGRGATFHLVLPTRMPIPAGDGY